MCFYCKLKVQTFSLILLPSKLSRLNPVVNLLTWASNSKVRDASDLCGTFRSGVMSFKNNIWLGVTGSEAMFLCLHTSLLYSNGNGCSLAEHQKPPTSCSINFSQQWYQMGIEGACIVEAQKHMILGQLRIVARQAKNAPLVRDSAYIVPS